MRLHSPRIADHPPYSEPYREIMPVMFAPHIWLTTSPATTSSNAYTLPSLWCTTSAGHEHSPSIVSLHTPFSSHTRA